LFFNLLAFIFRPRIICNSQFVASQFWQGRHAEVVHNGLPLGDVVPRRAADIVRSELGLPPVAPVIGMLGRLEYWKGHETFLDAAAKLSAIHPEVRYLIVGDATYGEPDYPDDLKQFAKDLGIADKVVFTGFRPDIYDLLNVMDIYVHPSIEPEPFGRGIIEAMALAIPVVASSEGGPLEIIDNGGTGFLVEPGNAESLSRVLAQMLDNPEVISVIGRNGRCAVERHFTLKRCVDDVTMILDEILL
jgi:glycosyltransferase involved in cell wall biosynthesis